MAKSTIQFFVEIQPKDHSQIKEVSWWRKWTIK